MSLDFHSSRGSASYVVCTGEDVSVLKNLPTSVECQHFPACICCMAEHWPNVNSKESEGAPQELWEAAFVKLNKKICPHWDGGIHRTTGSAVISFILMKKFYFSSTRVTFRSKCCIRADCSRSTSNNLYSGSAVSMAMQCILERNRTDRWDVMLGGLRFDR